MIQINDWSRRSGKTTKIIQMMEEDSNLYCIVPYSDMKKIYPCHLQSRIVASVDDLRGIVGSVVVEEGFLYKETDLIKMYYELGKLRLDVRVYGTSKQRELHDRAYDRI